jgi:hypothetical protein
VVTRQRLPNFFLAGVPKSGSTSLCWYLDQHPDIYMSPVKEPNFFAEELRVANFGEEFQRMAASHGQVLREFLAGPMTSHCSAGPVEAWADYTRLFHNAGDERAIGEASVCYLWSPSAAKNILARLPDAKFVIVLRNPIDRAYSQYRHMLAFAERRISFLEHFEASVSSGSTRISEMYPFLKFGLYGEQLDRLFRLAGRERVGIWYHDDFCRDPGKLVQDIFCFLEVDEHFQPDMGERHMEARVPRSYAANRVLRQGPIGRAIRAVTPPTMRARLRSAFFAPREQLQLQPADRALLVDYYKNDIAKLSDLLSRNFSHWL